MYLRGRLYSEMFRNIFISILVLFLSANFERVDAAVLGEGMYLSFLSRQNYFLRLLNVHLQLCGSLLFSSKATCGGDIEVTNLGNAWFHKF